jgi:tetratricopeptide (TPR) repeat protein
MRPLEGTYLQAQERHVADAFYAAQRYAEAADKYRILLQCDPTSTELMRQLGLSLALSGRVEEGIDICRNAVLLGPGQPQNRYALGLALSVAERLGEAIEQFEEVHQAEPMNGVARQTLVKALLRYGKRYLERGQGAAELPLMRVMELDPRNGEAASLLLQIYLDTDRINRAVQFVAEAHDHLRFDPRMKPLIARLTGHPRYKQVSEIERQARIRSAYLAPPSAVAAPFNHAVIDQRPARRGLTWQEATYNLMSILWCLLAAAEISLCLGMEEGPLRALLLFIGAARLLIGGGLVLQLEWVPFVARLLCFISLFFGMLGISASFYAGDPRIFVMNSAQIAMAILMLYLIGYMYD